jgi:archaellum component FlaC
VGKIIIELEKWEVEDIAKIFEEIRDDMNSLEKNIYEIVDEMKTLSDSLKKFQKEVSDIIEREM